jgi:SAM-dependent methyltransferase
MSFPERLVPDETSVGIVAIHEKRYRFALPHCEGRTVLDAGCGVGYGSALLATVAARVVGMDVSAEAIDYARTRYPRPNVEFLVRDLLELDLPDAGFDVVCSFEAIEHLADRDAFLGHVARTLRDDGVFFVSTPRVDRTNERPDNPYHYVEYSPADFEELLRRHFDDVELFGQRRPETRRHLVLRRLDVLGLRRHVGVVRKASRITTGTAPMETVTPEGIVIDKQAIDKAAEIVAVCRSPRRP